MDQEVFKRADLEAFFKALKESGAKVGESEGKALASHQLIGKGVDQKVFKRANIEAFFKALKESGNTLGNTLGYSYAAHTLPSTTDKLLDIFKSSYTAASNPSNTDKLLDIFKSAYTATSEPSITSAKVGESEGRALVSHQLIGKGMDQEVFKKADLEAFFKALKESGNSLGNTLGYSYAAHTLPSTTDKLLDIFKSSYTAANNPSTTDNLLDIFKSSDTAASEPSITKPSHFEHEGGSESEAEGLKDQGSEEAGGLEDQGSDSPVQSGDESVRDVQNEGHEAGEEIQIQEEAVEEQVEVPLRRSTRVKRDASEWVNTRNWVNTKVHYNAQAVEHPSLDIPFNLSLSYTLNLSKSLVSDLKEPSHFAHEGGSESVSELENQGLEEAGELGNRGTDSPVQSGEGSAREELNESQNEEDQRQGEARAEAEEQTEATTPQRRRIGLRENRPYRSVPWPYGRTDGQDLRRLSMKTLGAFEGVQKCSYGCAKIGPSPGGT
ncbi:hypothetical protein F2Q69_00014887 [Brassica cretica]|uniref:Uncharacterized protein n=1 Tax=Brassica cretica TaxID=69181 RepID=A0A8S9R923_BRACR|nr:hypothetical protein F2Q69_00014887 [Brassica cretica]